MKSNDDFLTQEELDYVLRGHVPPKPPPQFSQPLLERLDAGYTKDIATPPEFREAATLIRIQEQKIKDLLFVIKVREDEIDRLNYVIDRLLK